MNATSTAILTLALLFTATSGLAQDSPQSAAARRADEMATVISSADRDQYRRFVSEAFGGGMLNVPLESHLYRFSRIYDSSRGLRVHSVQASGANEATALLQNRLMGSWVSLNVLVEAEEPYRILGARFQSAQSPDPVDSVLSTDDVVNSLEQFMDALAEVDVFSGAVLLAKDGVAVFERAYGLANKDFGVPNRVDTKFNLGSMNKMFTAVAILQLVEDGRLSLDQPLADFLPDFPDETSAKQIRIEHLLTHTAGLGNFMGNRFRQVSKMSLRTVDDLIEFVRSDERLLFEPGSRYQYSNTGYLVLGKVIEHVSGQSHLDYVRSNIFRPAGMGDTDSYDISEVNPNLAVGYDKGFTDDGVVFRNNLFLRLIRGGPAGGGYSTVGDMLRFDRAFLSGELVDPATVELMITPKSELNSPDYGYGFALNGDASIVGHSGGFTGINSNLDMFLDSGWTAIVMSNYTDAAAPVWGKIRELISRAEDQVAASSTEH